MLIEYTLEDQLLVALPHSQGSDSIFDQSVVYVYSHSALGTKGVIINKPLELQVEDLLINLEVDYAQSKLLEYPVHMGGPLLQEQGFVLFQQKKHRIISNSKNTLVRFAKNGMKDDFLVFFGCAGWEKGQLEKEIMDNQWLLVPPDNQLIFSIPACDKWQAAAACLGVDIHLHHRYAAHA